MKSNILVFMYKLWSAYWLKIRIEKKKHNINIYFRCFILGILVRKPVGEDWISYKNELLFFIDIIKKVHQTLKKAIVLKIWKDDKINQKNS